MIILLAGVTGSGKTSIALELLKNYPIDIISVDSVQCYNKLKTFTNKSDDIETHKLVNICDFNINYDIEKFTLLCNYEIKKSLNNGRVPFLVGGSGFYFSRLELCNEKVYSFFITSKRWDIYTKIDLRCEEMIINGAIEEVLNLKKAGLTIEHLLGRSIGCRDTLILIESLQKGKVKQDKELKVNNEDMQEKVFDNHFILNNECEIIKERVNNLEKKKTKGLNNCAIQEEQPITTIQSADYVTCDQFNLFNQFLNDFKRRTRNYVRRQECWFRSKEFVWIDVQKFNAIDIIKKTLNKEVCENYLQEVHKQSINVNEGAERTMKTYQSKTVLLTNEDIRKLIIKIMRA